MGSAITMPYLALLQCKNVEFERGCSKSKFQINAIYHAPG